MIKNLVKHGNSWALVIDRPILELLKINPEAPVEITTDGRTMTVAAAAAVSDKEAARQARGRVDARHARAFRKLAE